MPILKIRRDEAIKLVHDRTNAYQLEKMSDQRLIDFLTEIGYGIDPNVPCYGWEFKMEKNENKKTT